MNRTSSFRSVAPWILALGCLGLVRLAMAAPASDINSPDKRRASVDLGVRLMKPVAPAPLPEDLVSPFSPSGFDLADPDEKAATTSTTVPGRVTPARVSNDRDILEQIANKIPPTGTMIAPGGGAMLIFGKQIVKIGQHLTVNMNGQDYGLDITGITSTTFTLRLNGEEITRPIKPGKSSP